MRDDELTRRGFLQASTSMAGVSTLRTLLPGLAGVFTAACGARDEAAPFQVLSNDEARELAAISARIIPTTDTPGANEAGVIYFVDQALNGIFASELQSIRDGLAEFQAPVAATFPGAERFSDLSEADQDRHLKAMESSAFFQMYRFATLMGMFGMSSYGGNRDNVGWKLVGLTPGQHAHQPPFGYYDAKFREGESNG